MLSISGSFAPLALGSNPDMGWCLTKSEARHRYRMTTRTPIGNLSLSLLIATQTLFMMTLYFTEVLCNRSAAILWMYIWLAVWLGFIISKGVALVVQWVSTDQVLVS